MPSKINTETNCLIELKVSSYRSSYYFNLEFDVISMATKKRSLLGINHKNKETKTFGMELKRCTNENQCEEIKQLIGRIGI